MSDDPLIQWREVKHRLISNEFAAIFNNLGQDKIFCDKFLKYIFLSYFLERGRNFDKDVLFAWIKRKHKVEYNNCLNFDILEKIIHFFCYPEGRQIFDEEFTLAQIEIGELMPLRFQTRIVRFVEYYSFSEQKRLAKPTLESL